MNRNWDLIRQILLMADGRNVEQVKTELIEMGYMKDDVDFHFDILGTGKGEAGFITLTSTYEGGYTEMQGDMMVRLGMEEHVALSRTWNGLNFIELIGSDVAWEHMKRFCENAGFSLCETVIHAVANQAIALAYKES